MRVCGSHGVLESAARARDMLIGLSLRHVNK